MEMPALRIRQSEQLHALRDLSTAAIMSPAAPTESTACRAEHHELCELAGCPCLCHSKTHDSGVAP